MESHKSKVLRVVKYIYNISPVMIPTIIFANSKEKVHYKCKCVDGWNLFHINSNESLYELGFDTLDDLRDRLLSDFMIGLIDDVRCR